MVITINEIMRNYDTESNKALNNEERSQVKDETLKEKLKGDKK